jgi:tetratricopeptide (TPR) repeat protein
LAWCYYFARRYPEAIVQIGKTTELGPGSWSPHVRLGRVHEVSEDRKQAITEYQKGYDLGENSQRHEADRNLLLASIYALEGERGKALEQIDQVQELAHGGKATAYYLAVDYLRLGDKSQAIDWLERSYRDKEAFITYIKVDPLLDPLRGDPRFEALAEKILPRGAK